VILWLICEKSTGGVIRPDPLCAQDAPDLSQTKSRNDCIGIFEKHKNSQCVTPKSVRLRAFACGTHLFLESRLILRGELHSGGKLTRLPKVGTTALEFSKSMKTLNA